MMRRCMFPTPEVEALLAHAMFPDAARIARNLEAYRTDPGRQLFLWETGGRVVCAVGLHVRARQAEVLHIGTDPQERGKGFARALLSAVASALDLTALSAETDEDAVGFYRRSGFQVREAAPRGGQRRFACEWRAAG